MVSDQNLLKIGGVYEFDAADIRQLTHVEPKRDRVRYVRPFRRPYQKYAREMRTAEWLKWARRSVLVDLELGATS